MNATARLTRQLQEERDRLSADSAARRDAAAPVTLDQPAVGRLSRMDALQMQAMAMAADRRRRERIARIDAALARIEAGGYGECLECGEEIAPKRLAFDAAVTVCIRCAGQDS